MLKIIFFKKKKKLYFDAFLREKNFEKQALPHSQTPLEGIQVFSYLF
jgi:hypothetical protein